MAGLAEAGRNLGTGKMSTATTIIESMVMEGKLDAGEAPVLIAGHFTGELNAVEVILDRSTVRSRPTGPNSPAISAASWLPRNC